MAGAILTPTQLVEAAQAAPCPACRVREELTRASHSGAQAKAATLAKSPKVRAVFVHTCGQGSGESTNKKGGQ